MRFGTWGVFLLVAGFLFGLVAAAIDSKTNEALATAMQQEPYSVIWGFHPVVEEARRASGVYRILSYTSLACLVFGVAGCCVGLLGAVGRTFLSAAGAPAKSTSGSAKAKQPKSSSGPAFREFAWGDAPAKTLVAAQLTDRDQSAIKRFGMTKADTPWRKFHKPDDDLTVRGVHVKELAYWFEDDSFRLAIAYLDGSQYLPLLRSLKSAYGQGRSYRDGKSTLWRSRSGGTNLLAMPELGQTPPTLIVFDGHRYQISDSDLPSGSDLVVMYLGLAVILALLLLPFMGC